MDRVGKVDRCRATRQLDDITLGREAEHLVSVHLQLYGFEEFAMILIVLKPLCQRGNPLYWIHSELVFDALAVAVGPMRSNA